MRITGITAYAVQLPLKEGSYSWNTQSFSSFDSTVVVVDTDEGLQGYGEICPLGPGYMPSFAAGARVGMAEIAPQLIGLDPRQIEIVGARMDEVLKGHPYAKSGIDMAIWDVAAKAAGVSVATLLGGAFRDRVKLFRVIGRDTPEAMVERLLEYRAEGFIQYQMKVGERLDTDIARMFAVTDELLDTETLAADANTGWRQHEAMRVADAVAGLPLYIEQPCLTYEECLAVRPHLQRPLILDEVMDSRAAIRRGAADGAMDVINLKISRFGGLSGARRARDLCVDLGITMTIEDTWGGEIATAAIAHLAASTPNGFHFQSSAFHDYHSRAIADGAPVVADGHMLLADSIGLGVTPLWDVLGEPIFSISA
ncbi:MAG: L-alanine-DL-glutamate epimerase-like enolase superfamily enzyme [Verrucomicrobiales bacterium]|jgi:L-alanine-DL-glutamate epimerase-like enolase superfamily enzyme